MDDSSASGDEDAGAALIERLDRDALGVALSYLRPVDREALTECSKSLRAAPSPGEIYWKYIYSFDFGPYRPSPLQLSLLILPFWRDRYRQAWVLRLQPLKRALGINLETKLSSLHPVWQPPLLRELEFPDYGYVAVNNDSESNTPIVYAVIIEAMDISSDDLRGYDAEFMLSYEDVEDDEII